MKFSDILRRFDAYPRTQGQRTHSGATVTIISTIIVTILIIWEFHNYLHKELTEDLFVDTSRGHKLQINLDITIANIACSHLTLDAMDSSGDQHLHIEHSVFKKRLDLDGNPIEEEPTKEIISSIAAQEKNNTCGSCYGAQVNETHCCNTCEDVIAAYRLKKWNVQLENIDQCKNSLNKYKRNDKDAFKEGCRIYGNFQVHRMAGNFHIAPGSSFSIDDRYHIHDFHVAEFKLTHTINHLSFGEKIEFANTHPLDGLHVEPSNAKSQMYNYYIKIVPTIFIKKNGRQIHTNQFSATRHKKELTNRIENGMPGLFFHYELSPLMVKYEEKERSFGHFATNICSIIGGVFTVAGFIVSFLHNSLEFMKIELNKFS